jgi:MFS family permease
LPDGARAPVSVCGADRYLLLLGRRFGGAKIRRLYDSAVLIVIKPWLRAALALFAVGWGANQFASLLLAYRSHAGVSASVADALFGFYALGLIPALLVGGPLSDRYGRRALARPAVLLSILATVVLIAGHASLPLLFTGRVLAGLASGAVFAPGTAWVKELSAPPYDSAAGTQAGARRAAIALSAGFGLGPLVAGIIAQYAPHPLVNPYLAHLVVIAVVVPLMWTVPETVAVQSGGSVLAGLRIRSAARPRFRRVVAPLAPWVFTSASISITIGPAVVARSTHSYDVVFAGILAGLTLGTGVLVQPLARRLDAVSDIRGAATGLLAATAGCVVEAIAAHTAQPAVAVLAAVLLGGGYGFCLVAGLLETQRIAVPHELAGLTAVYYALTYIGFAVPIALAEFAHLTSYLVLLLAMAVLALVTLGAVLFNAKSER